MKNNNDFAKSLKELNTAKRLMNEVYENIMAQEENPNPQGVPPTEMQGGEGMGEETPLSDPQMNDIIDQIRQLAIKGIAQYADQVDSEKYQSLKKIWLLTDKFYEEALGDNNDKKKF